MCPCMPRDGTPFLLSINESLGGSGYSPMCVLFLTSLCGPGHNVGCSLAKRSCLNYVDTDYKTVVG